jgi:ligand-binding sensor domain-containing protein/signal transduction histidine kinase
MSFSQADFRFENLRRKDGLSHNNVYAIIQDRNGFMWFGTQDGVNRYDGYSFIQYYNDPANINSLISNNFGEILEDKKGYLWFGTHYGGLDRFDPLLNEFTHFVYNEQDKFSISSNNIRNILEDKNGNFWIATSGGGINYYNSKTGQFIRYIHSDKDPKSIASNDVDALVIDKNNNLWVGTSKSLDYFDLKTKQFTHYILGYENFDQAREISIRSLMIDKNGFLWIGSSDGLFVFNSEKKLVSEYKYNLLNSYSLSDNYVNKIFEDSNGDIWIGTENGLNLFDKEKKQFITFKYDVRNNYSISNNRVWTLFEDRSRILWIATKGGGINKLDLKRKKFYNIQYLPKNQFSLSHPSVTSIAGDTAGNIWLGTDGGGICIFNRNKNTIENIQHILKKQNVLTDDQIWSTARSGNKIWLGMHTGGINSIERISGEYKVEKYFKKNDSTGISNNQVNAILIDKQGFLWIGTRNGLDKMIDTSQKMAAYFMSYKKNFNNSNSLSDNYITSIYQDYKGTLWIGTYSSGLNSLNPLTGEIKNFKNDVKNSLSISNNSIHAIFEDHLGTLWIGTAGGGLNKLEKDGESFKRYFMKNGLPSNEIMAMLEDYKGHIWISTAKGLSNFDPINEKFVNFDVGDGLLSDGFNWGAAYQDNEGWMYFGTNSGLVYFQPNQIELNSYKPQIVITRFSFLKNKEWYTNSLYISEFNSNKNELVLDYDKNIFSVEFSALDFTKPDENLYEYKIEGLSNDWIDNGNKTTIMVTNLEPGNYILKIRGSNNDRFFNESGISVPIIVKPPFWHSRFFYIIIGIISILIFISIYGYLLKLKTNKILALKNQELEQTNIKLQESEKNLKTLNETKDKFFSIIAHDLRNPFNPLLSLTELLDEDYDNLSKKEVHGFVKEIRIGAKKLFDLLENLLQWALTQTMQIKFKQVAVDIVELLSNNVDLLKINAEEKNISLKFEMTENIQVLADENMLNCIIRNLINNAIKFSHENSEVHINIFNEKEICKVEVKDQGIGLSSEHVYSIFKGFSKSSFDSVKGRGTGLGLVLCKEFVDKNGGEIWVESEIGKGSSFFFTVNKFMDWKNKQLLL